MSVDIDPSLYLKATLISAIESIAAGEDPAKVIAELEERDHQARVRMAIRAQSRAQHQLLLLLGVPEDAP